MSFLLTTVFEGWLFGISIFSFQGVINFALRIQASASYEINSETDLSWFYVVSIWLESALIMMTDIVVVWRAFVLLRDRRWKLIVMAVTSFLLIVFIATTIIPAGGSSPVNEKTFALREHIPIDVYRLLFFGRYFISLLINVAATAIISYVYWIHRKSMALGFEGHPSTKVEKVLVLLIESGVIFGIFQIINITFYYIDGMVYYLERMVWAIYIGFVSVYPAVVVALVDTNNTVEAMYSVNASLYYEGDASRDNHRLETLRFSLPDNAKSQTTVFDGNEDAS